MRNTRLFALLMVLLMALSVGGAVVAQEPVNLVLAGWSSSPAEDEALQSAIDAFEEANPGITVEFVPSPDHVTTMQTAFASGDYANVFYVDSSKLEDWVAAGVIAPAEGNVEDVEGLFPNLRESFTANGAFQCVPKDFSSMALQYNTDLFDAAGLAYPTNDWTWDDLRAAAEALTGENAEGQPVVGLVTPPELPRWMPFLFQAGGSVFDAEGNPTLNTPEAAEALSFYVGLVEDGIAAPPSAVDSGWGGEAFANQRTAMAMEGNWVIKFLQDTAPDLNWGVVELPAGPAGEATMAFTVCYGVAADNDHPEESWALVNFLTGPEGAMRQAEASFGPMPARESAMETWTANFGEEMNPYISGVANAHPWRLPAGWQEFIDTFNSGLQQAFDGQMFAEDVLTSAQEVGEEIQARGGAAAEATEASS